MTTQYDFSNEDWHRIAAAPVLVGMAVARAEDSGFVGSIRETRTLMAQVSAGSADGPAGALIAQAAATDTEADYEVFKALAPTALADDAERACSWLSEILAAVASPTEAEGYKQWVLQVATAVADAAKEHGTRVSKGEQDVLARVSEALGL